MNDNFSINSKPFNPAELDALSSSSKADKKSPVDKKQLIETALKSLTDKPANPESSSKDYTVSKFPDAVKIDDPLTDSEIDDLLNDLEKRPPSEKEKVNTETQLNQLDELSDMVKQQEEKAARSEGEYLQIEYPQVEHSQVEHSEEKIRPSSLNDHLRSGLKRVNAQVTKAKEKAEDLVNGALDLIESTPEKALTAAVILKNLGNRKATSLSVDILKNLYYGVAASSPVAKTSGGIPKAMYELLRVPEKSSEKPSVRMRLAEIGKETQGFLKESRDFLKKNFITSYPKFPPSTSEPETNLSEMKSETKEATETAKIDETSNEAHETSESHEMSESETTKKPLEREFSTKATPLIHKNLEDLPNLSKDSYDPKVEEDRFNHRVPEKPHTEIASPKVEISSDDASTHLEKVVRLGKEMITNELIVNFLIGDQNINAYHGDLDEEYAEHLLFRLPANSALLFSEGTGDSLSLVAVSRDPEGLAFHSLDITDGFEPLAQDLRNIGLQFVNKDEAGELAANRWLRIVPEEATDKAPSSFLANPQRQAILNNNVAVAQLSSYYQGLMTVDEAEDYFQEIEAPVGTALLRYDDKVDGYFVSYVETDEKEGVVIRHQRAVDVEKTLDEFSAFNFEQNGLQEKLPLGKNEVNHWGQMSDNEAAELMKGAPDTQAVFYSRLQNDGRTRFFAGVNKVSVDEAGHKKSTFTTYDIGYRPDFDGAWLSFYAENPHANLVASANVEIAEKMAVDILQSPYTHHNISKEKAEKLLRGAAGAAVIVHTTGSDENELITLSIKTPNNKIVHHTLPQNIALHASLANFVSDLPLSNHEVPHSFGALLSQLNESQLTVLPPVKTKKSQLTAGIKANFTTKALFKPKETSA